MHSILRILVLTPLLAACAPAPTEKGPEHTAPLDGALRAFRRPTEHGALALGTTVAAEITSRAESHAWTFELSADAAVALHTTGERPVDTVLYLYREGPRGWGSYLARNDDSGGTVWSALSRGLRAGRYRVLVKGYDHRARGPFELASECRGEGCVTTCRLGSTFRELRDSALFEVVGEQVVDSPEGLEPLRAAQLVDAVRIAYEEARDVASALASVDQHEVNVIELRELASGQGLVIYEYGAGDNSYGAVFAADSRERAAEIHDGDLYECRIYGEPAGAREGAECGEPIGIECATGLRCHGYVDEAGAGRCVADAAIEGEGEACSAELSCPSERLVCGGLSRSERGVCVPAWMRGTFGEDWPLDVPEGGEVLVRSVVAYGLGSADLDVVLRARVEHPRPEDLRITLTNPAGTEAVVLDGAPPGVRVIELDRAVLGLPGAEPVNGEWTLRVFDRGRGGAGTLHRWALEITSVGR